MKRSVKFFLIPGAFIIVLLAALLWQPEKTSADGGHSHCLCAGNTVAEEASHICETLTYTAWTDAGRLPLTSGSYYLDTDVTLTEAWIIPANTDIRLCLNGHKVQGSVSHIISTYNGSGHNFGVRLSVTDCRTTGVIQNTDASNANGGGTLFFGSEGGTFSLYAGTLQLASGCTSTALGAVAQIPGGTVNIYGGSIANGKTTGNGANLAVTSKGNVNLYGGEIKNGYATKNGGGVYVYQGTFTMYGGHIYGNTTEDSGGNMAVQNSGVFTMKGGLISDGIAKKTNRDYTSSNIFIHATSKSSACYFEGGKITGRVYLMAVGTVGFAGTPVIADGTFGFGIGNTNTAVKIQTIRIGTPDKERMENGAEIYISAFSRSGNAGFTFEQGDSQYVLALDAEESDLKAFQTNRALYSAPAYHDGMLLLQNLKSHCVCGGTLLGRKNADGTEHVCKNVTWTEWKGENDGNMPTSTGNYYISSDFTNKVLNITKDGAVIRVDLNGRRVTATALRLYTTYNGSAHINNAEWSICDTSLSSGEVKMNRTSSDQGAIIWSSAKQKSVMTLYGGTYYASNTSYVTTENKHGALFSFQAPASNVTVYDSVIRGGHAAGYGGNFYQTASSASTLTMIGATLSGGISDASVSGTSYIGGQGGNLCVLGSCTVKLQDCTFINGTANYGVKPSLEAYNGYGGNIFINTSKPAVLTNVTSVGGKARTGGNVFLYGSGTKTVTGCTFTDGKARDSVYTYYESGSTEKKYLDIPGSADNLYTGEGLVTVSDTRIFGETGFSSVSASASSMKILSGEFSGIVGGSAEAYIIGGYFEEKPEIGKIASEYSAKPVVKTSEQNPQLTLNYQIVKGYEVFTTSRACELQNIAQTSGGGVYVGSEKATVRAYPTSGYRFVGWFTETENGLSASPVSTEETYTFTEVPKSSVMMVALYEADESLVTLTVTASRFTVKEAGQAAVAHEHGFVALYKKGTGITLSFTDEDLPFVSWSNPSDKVVSRAKQDYTFTLGATTVLKAETETGTPLKTVVFYNDKQQILKSYQVETLSEDQIPEAPLRVGQIFKGWKISGTDRLLTRDELLTEINLLLGTNLLLEAETVFEAEETGMSIYVQKYIEKNGKLTPYGSAETLNVPSTGIQKITAEQSVASGEKFAYAAIERESAKETVSELPEFIIKAIPEETVLLVYRDGGSDEAPAVSMTQAVAKKEADGTYTYTFAASRNIPASYEVLSHGMILTNDTLIQGAGLKQASLVTYLDCGQSAVLRSNDLQNAGVMSLNLGRVADAGLQFYLRAFAVLKDDTGEIITVYSDLMYGSEALSYDFFKEGEDFTEGASIPGALEIGAKDIVVYLPITTTDGKTPVKVSVTSSDDKIRAVWTREDPTRISVTALELGAKATVSAVVDGIQAGACEVTCVSHSHAVATLSHIQDGTGSPLVTWTPWTDAANLPVVTGNYYLETDVTTNKVYTLPTDGDIKLCLNGHKVLYQGTGRLYSSYSKTGVQNSALAICDCREESGEIVLDSNVKTNQGTFYWGNGKGNHLDIYGGIIRAGENYLSNATGALICLESDSSANMYGGEIRDGFSTVAGGNLALGGTSCFRMYGGTISGGTIHSNDKNNTYGGNVYMNGVCRFEMYEGALVTAGEARENIHAGIQTSGVHQGHGANFYISGGAKMIADKAKITDGYCAVSGGNFQIAGTGTTVTLRDTFVTGGYSWMAGGILLSVATLNIEGHTVISGNSYSNSDDTSRGGGIVVSSGTLNISGTPYIYDNFSKKTGSQNNLHLMPGICVNAGTLNEGAKIGVTCALSTAMSGHAGTAQGFAAAAAGQSEYFIPDDRISFSVKENGSKLDMVAFEGDFRVGFARAEINPESSVPLAGYGRTEHRMSTNILDGEPLTVTCIAVTGNGGTVLMYTVDTIRVGWVDEVRQEVSRATGVPAHNILMTATHTHSGPEVSFTNQSYPEAYNAIQQYKVKYINRFRETAVSALEDREYVALTYSGAVDTVYQKDGKSYTMNWVRHYTLKDEKGNYAGVKGDNFNQLYNKDYTGSVDADGDLVNPAWKTNGITISGHTTDADPSMRLIKFVRTGGKKDVVLVNWRAHPHKTGGSTKTDISPDVIAPFRNELEKQTGCLAAYFQGASGNLNTNSSISVENYSNDYIVYGKELAKYAVKGLDSAEEIECDGTIEVLYENYSGLRKNQSYYSAEEVAYATKIQKMFQDQGNSNALYELCRLSGNMVHSAYDANSIVSKAKTTAETASIPIYAFRIGNLGFTEAPYEMFDTNSKTIRENGLSMGFDNVFVMGYSNGSASYVPSQIGFTQGTDSLFGSYEADQCQFRPIQYYVDEAGIHYSEQNDQGTLTPIYIGEDLAGHFTDLLSALKSRQ